MARERVVGGDPPAAGRLEQHWTEWNASWRWGRPIHDSTNLAAYICRAIHRVHGLVDSFAFWTISDIFKEFPYPRAVFVGGFGLLTIDGLPKPGYHAYQLLHKLGAAELPATREDDGSGDREAGNLDCWATRSEGGYQVLLANYTPPALEGAPPARAVEVRLRGLAAGRRLRLTEYRVDAEHANAPAAWEAMGRPDTPTREQLALLRAAAELRPEPAGAIEVDAAGGLRLPATLPPGSVAFLDLARG